MERLDAEVAEVEERRREPRRRDHLVDVECPRPLGGRALGVDAPAGPRTLDALDRAVERERAAAEGAVLEGVQVAGTRRGREGGVDGGVRVVRRAEDHPRGPREQRLGDLVGRVPLADHEDGLALERVGRAPAQVVVVRHELDPGGARRPPRLGHADGEDGEAAAVLAVARPDDEAAVLGTRRLPGAPVPRLDAAPLGERRVRRLDLRAEREVALAVHELGEQGGVLGDVGDEAVPVGPVVRVRVPRLDGVAADGRVQTLEEREVAEHPRGPLVAGEQRVLDAPAAQVVGELEPARARPDHDHRVLARREGPVAHRVRRRRASPSSRRYITCG